MSMGTSNILKNTIFCVPQKNANYWVSKCQNPYNYPYTFKMLQVTFSSHILLDYLLINNAQGFIPLNLQLYITITVFSPHTEREKSPLRSHSTFQRSIFPPLHSFISLLPFIHTVICPSVCDKTNRSASVTRHREAITEFGDKNTLECLAQSLKVLKDTSLEKYGIWSLVQLRII